MWRRIQFKDPDYAALSGKTILQISPDGDGGTGCFFGTFQVQIGSCYAEFEISDRVIDVKVLGDGSMKIRNGLQSRQRIRLEGDPPQRDGFEPDLRGARGRSIYSFTVPLTSLASSVDTSQAMSVATFTPRQPENGTGSFRRMNARPNIVVEPAAAPLLCSTR